MKKIYVLLVSIAFMACGNSEKNTDSKTVNNDISNEITISKQQFESQNMQLGKLTEQAFSTIVKANGMIDVPPENKASVSSFIGGYVTKIPLLIGDKVKKGQLVATLESTEFLELQQQYLELAEQLNYLKNEYERQKNLYNENITSEKNYLKAESSYKSNLAIYNGLRKKLQMLNIDPIHVEQGQLSSSINLYAPINGYITKVNVSNGMFVSSANELLEIINTDHIHLELNVFEKDILKVKKEQKINFKVPFEKDILKVKKEQKINFKVPEASSENYLAKVHLVGTSIDENRIIRVHGHIEDEESTNFIVGMFVEASIIANSENRLALPNEAFSKIGEHHFVLLLESKTEKDFKFKKVKVEVGSKNENYTEVLNGNDLKDKDILTKGSFMLLSE